jgi:hypothetical protein
MGGSWVDNEAELLHLSPSARIGGAVVAVVKGRQYIYQHRHTQAARALVVVIDRTRVRRPGKDLTSPLSHGRRRISWRKKKKKKENGSCSSIISPHPRPVITIRKVKKEKKENRKREKKQKVTNGFFNLAKQFQLGRTDVLSARFFLYISRFFFSFFAWRPTRFNRLGKWEETFEKNQPPHPAL